MATELIKDNHRLRFQLIDLEAEYNALVDMYKLVTDHNHELQKLCLKKKLSCPRRSIECPICYDTKRVSLFATKFNCEHRICHDCVIFQEALSPGEFCCPICRAAPVQ